MPLIAVKHNIEVAHRLYEMPGKCENIHGHSMWVTMKLEGGINKQGLLYVDETGEGLDFGSVKKRFRSYLDTTYDHRILLNKADPWAVPVVPVLDPPVLATHRYGMLLPGLNVMPADPTTEHLALWIAEWASEAFKTDLTVEVWETAVNMAAVHHPYVGRS